VSCCRVMAPWKHSPNLAQYRLSSLRTTPCKAGPSCDVVVELSANLKHNHTCDASDRQFIDKRHLADGTERTVEIHEMAAALPEANCEESLLKSTQKNTKAGSCDFLLGMAGTQVAILPVRG
jgi:hypothetical protein